jgi:outer membrane receptor protein involved in Fe transport
MCFRRAFRLIALGVALLATTASAAFALNGRVVDKRSGQPVAGAELMIVGLSGSVKTDADGRFTWTPDPIAPFEVLVVLPDGRLTRPAIVKSVDTAAVLTILIEPAVNEEVTVTAGLAPSIDTAPAAGMTMLAGRDIALRQPANLMQALENVPGVNQVSEGQAAVPAVRGLARGRTLIMIDGARVTSERRVGPSATFMDPASIASIDIARGPGSVAYGSDAFGGVISVQTPRPIIGGPWKGRASGTAGAGIPDRGGYVEIQKGFATGAMLVQGHARKVEDYDGPEAVVLNSGYEDRGFLARVDKTLGGGLLSLGWQSDFGRNIERPRNNSAATRFYYPFENSHRATVAYENQRAAGLDLLRVQGFIGTIEQRTDQDRVPTDTVTRQIVRADIKSKDFSLRAIGEKAVSRSRLEFGIDITGRTDLEAHDIQINYNLAGAETGRTDNLSTDWARRVDTGIFIQADHTLAGRLRATGGARVDFVSSRNRDGFFGDKSLSHEAGSGFAALTVGPFGGFSFTGQISRGFRDPTLSDRFYRGPSGRGFITGNPDLEPETSLQIDLGARYAAERLRANVYVYQYRITDLVERFTTATDLFFFRNRGKAQYRGIEVEAQADLGHGFTMEFSAQTARGRALDEEGAEDASDGLWLDDVAPNMAAVVLRKRLLDKGSAHVRVATFAADNRPGISEISAPGYTLLDAGASWWLTSNLELRANGRNLLNRTYYASPDPRFVFAPGRSASVTAAISF